MQHFSVTVRRTEPGQSQARVRVFGLTAVTLDISRQVLRRPLSSRSLCWMTLCMAAGLSEPISISWLADNRAVSRVCWWNTHKISNQETAWLYLSLQPFRTANICTAIVSVIRTCGTFSPLPSHLKRYLLSVQLLSLLLLCPKDFIQLTHPAEFSLAREKERRDPSFQVRMIIVLSRTAVDLHRHPFLLADMCRRNPCSHLDPTVRGKNGN